MIPDNELVIFVRRDSSTLPMSVSRDDSIYLAVTCDRVLFSIGRADQLLKNRPSTGRSADSLTDAGIACSLAVSSTSSGVSGTVRLEANSLSQFRL